MGEERTVERTARPQLRTILRGGVRNLYSAACAGSALSGKYLADTRNLPRYGAAHHAPS